MMRAMDLPNRSKTVATWLAALGGGLGLHRFYLHGWRDPWGWLLPLPTLIGLLGVLRMRSYGMDDHLAWVLTPVLGIALAATMLSAIVYGLTPDERWNARYNAAAPERRTGWGNVLGVIVALVLGAGVLMATLAFSAQRYFEYSAESRL
ncbi:MAG: hypothetical protein JSR59_26910 [Proteobacteria bacterium]|nr:hypothetical protein [Pseudomonadota bacterium]